MNWVSRGISNSRVGWGWTKSSHLMIDEEWKVTLKLSIPFYLENIVPEQKWKWQTNVPNRQSLSMLTGYRQGHNKCKTLFQRWSLELYCHNLLKDTQHASFVLISVVLIVVLSYQWSSVQLRQRIPIALYSSVHRWAQYLFLQWRRTISDHFQWHPVRSKQSIGIQLSFSLLFSVK